MVVKKVAVMANAAVVAVLYLDGRLGRNLLFLD